MRGSLGEKIGEGATADIHVWAPGQIVKLFKIDVSQRFSRREARMTRAAVAAGAPEVFDEVTVEGRFGIVLQRLDGPTLLQLLQTRAVTSEQVGTILARSLHIRSQDAAAAGCRLSPRLDRCSIADLPRHTSEAHRYRCPHPD